MLDQSYSAKNFYKIFIYENRKGNNLEKEFFKKEIYQKYTSTLKEINKLLRKNFSAFYNEKSLRKYIITKELFLRYKNFLNNVKKNIKREKEIELLKLLEKVSDNIEKPDFKLEITTKIFNSKKVYTLKKTIESYFAMKQLQYNFYSLYGIKQSNRNQIVNQVKHLLNDRIPKYIIRADIKGFYESIPNKKVLDALNADNLLSPTSKKFIKQIIRNYEKLAGASKGIGIPRGIGISSYLAEYYMRIIDKKIRELVFISYYERYVDDMFIVFNPTHEHASEYYSEPSKKQFYFQTIEKIILDEGLNINTNPKKLNIIDLLNKNHNQCNEIEFLGYKYVFNNPCDKEIKIYFTDNKIKKYKNRIRLSFLEYQRQMQIDSHKAYRDLKNRIKYLTGNTRLVNNKNYILVGIYYSNKLLTEVENLIELDKSLKWYLQRKVKNIEYKKKLQKFKFIEGFKNNGKNFHLFKSRQLEEIMNIWK